MRRRNCKKVNKLLAMMLSVIMVLSLASMSVFSAETDKSYVKEGEVVATASGPGPHELTTDYLYREDCFMRSSFLGCDHLPILSLQLATASISWTEADAPSADCSQDSKNLKNFLEDMGFEDFAVNKYYTIQKKENSMGVGVAHRTIKSHGKTYTLLAIEPRSAGYMQEWAGNFIVGDGDLHDGFMSGRDECLRFVKQYLDTYDIKGDLKIWTSGYSRGAGVSNLIAAFFADGGIEYFGGDYSITPEDVYCYTYGTPLTVKSSYPKSEELSVEGARGGEYANDTPGDQYSYTGTETSVPDAEVFGGIRNFNLTYDSVAKVPLSIWGYTRFGTDIYMDTDLGISTEAMLAELKGISPGSYDELLNGYSASDFKFYTLDPLNMGIVPDTSAPDMNLDEFMDDRLLGASSIAKTSDAYVQKGVQGGLKAVAAIGSMIRYHMDGILDNEDLSFVKPALFTYLSYASERLQAEGKATSENGAAALAIEGAISYVTGEPIDNDTFTIDNFLELLTKYIVDNKDSKLSKTAVSGLLGLFPDSYRGIAIAMLAAYNKESSEGQTVADEDVLFSYLYACAYGAEEGSNAQKSGYMATPKEARRVLYTLMPFIVTNVDSQTVQDIIGRDSAGNLDGSGSFENGVGLILGMMMTETDDAGNVIASFTNFDDAADYHLRVLADTALAKPIADVRRDYGEEFYNDLMKQMDDLKNNMPSVRAFITHILFYSEGESFDTEKNIQRACTLIKSIGFVPVSHHYETFMAYLRVDQNMDNEYVDHYIEHFERVEPTCEADGNPEYWHSFDADGDTYYEDRYLGAALSKEDLTLDKLGHLAGNVVYENRVEPTYDKEGSYEEVTYCERCGKELSRNKVVIPVIPKDDPTPTPGGSPEPSTDAKTPENLKTVKTGDDSPLVMWYIVMLVGLAGSGLTLYLKKKDE